MKRFYTAFSIVIAIIFFIFASPINATEVLPVLHITPQNISEGDPIMITISGTSALPVKSTPSLYFFRYKNMPTAFYGVDLKQKTGTTTITVSFKGGLRASSSFFIAPRIQPEEYIPVPESLGGNSAANQTRVVSIIEKDNANIALAYSRKDKSLWTSTFSFPVASPITVTDPYGFNRNSGEYVIAHKGVDFHAPPGTKVYAINRGVVRTAKNYATYGNTVIIDHGLGLLSIYMHLSKIYVNVGELVKNGQLIGLSGETGYSEGPHLHLTVRINGISIDPMAFFALFGVK